MKRRVLFGVMQAAVHKSVCGMAKRCKRIMGVMLIVSTWLYMQAQITGVAFRDYNGNGVQDAGEPGVANIEVKAYSNAALPTKDQLVDMAVTDQNGNYTLNPPVYPVRLEFTITSVCNLDPTQDFSATFGNTYGTAVQFAQADGEVHNYAIQYPYDFSTDDNPYSYVAIFGNGDPLAPGSNSANDAAIVRFRYKWSGYASNSGRGATSGNPWQTMAVLKQVGSVWGMAYSRQAKKLWVAATLRRHAGMGPLGSGGIYWLDVDPPYNLNASLDFIDLDDLGFPTNDETSPYTDAIIPGSCGSGGAVNFSPVVGTNTDRGLPADKTQPSADPAAWDQMGKVSLGDMDISEDGRYLYVVNLYDRKLYEIDLVDPYNPQAPTAANAAQRIKAYQIPDPCVGTAAGEYRPWALKIKRGKVYVGIVCSAQNQDGSSTGGTAADMTANVYSFDIATKTWSAGPVIPPFTFDYRNGDKPWLPWRNDWWRDGFEVNGSPIITDIEIDANGNFILGITDRHGSQMGHQNADICGNCCPENGAMVGDILQAERNKLVTNCEYSYQLTPEYYNDNEIHTESTMGALAVHFTADFDGVLSTYMDPIGIWSSGVTLYDNTTGARVQTPDANNNPEEGYEIIYSSSSNQGRFGKYNSLGDVEIFEIVPPIEIGNLVWLDKDGDGIQDGDEPGIAGVDVELLDSNGVVVATATTDANGGYYFNHTNVPPNGPSTNTKYFIRISPAHFTNEKGVAGTPLQYTYLTLTDETGAGAPDRSDNDASLVAGGLAQIMVMTGKEGENNHTFDFGFVPCDVDLALRLTTTEKYVSIGEDVTFDITIFNQGCDTVSEITITDYVPPGFAFVPASNPGWVSVGGNKVQYTLTGLYFTPGQDTTIQIVLQAVAGAGPGDFINEAEISEVKDVDGNVRDDVDSTPDMDPNNDNNVIPGSPDDNRIDGDAKNNPGDDEDDNDVEEVKIFDLALIKEIVTPGPYSYGDVIEFRITVFNQSQDGVVARNVQIVDYVPQGFSYDPAQNPGWSPFVTNMPTTTITTDIPAGASASVSIFLTLDPSTDPANSWVNYAEIKSSEDADGVNTTNEDWDSTPDMDPNNDIGGNPDSPQDNHVLDDGLDTNNDGIIDEDDHDPARVEVVDLALRKEAEYSTPPHYGQNVFFHIRVYNQGNVPLTNIVVTDYLPAGYFADPASNPGWDFTDPSNPTYTITSTINPGGWTTVTLATVLQPGNGGAMDWDNYAEITAMEDTNGTDRSGDDADSNPGSDGPGERAVKPGDPADDNITSNDKGGEEDDHDPAGVEIYDLALRKRILTPMPHYYGDVVTFEITVYNQGNRPVRDVKVVDYVPDGYEFQASNIPTWIYTNLTQQAFTTLPGVIPPGDSAKVTIDLKILPSTNPDDWTNYAEIYEAHKENGDLIDPNEGDIDSMMDTDPNNDTGGGVNVPGEDDNIDGNKYFGQDEDDHDPSRAMIFDLALKNVLTTPQPYSYGQIHTFKMTVYNQGNKPAANIKITNFVPPGYQFDPAMNPTWVGGAPTPMYIHSGPLAPGDSLMVTIDLVLQMTNGGTMDWIDYAEVTSFEDTLGNVVDDADSYPGTDAPHERAVKPGDAFDNVVSGHYRQNNDEDEDDHDPDGPAIFDLAMYKTSDDTGPFNYGDDVTFTIYVVNQGNLDAYNVEVTDYVHTGFVFNAAANPSWTYDNATKKATTVIPGPIPPGDTVAVNLVLTIQQAYEPDAWDNFAELSAFTGAEGAPVADIDSDPDNTESNDAGGQVGTADDDNLSGNGKQGQDEDDHDPHRVQIVDFALKKWVPNKAPYYLPGDIVPFKIVVYNQGNVVDSIVKVNDYMPQGFVFDPALNPGWVDMGGGLLMYTHVGPIASQDSVEIPLNLEVTIAAMPTIDDWTNWAEIAQVIDQQGNDVGVNDADSNPASDAPHERDVEPDGPNDNNVLGDWKNAGQDEDDHDPEKVQVTGALGDKVWDDLNGNGIQDPGEPGVPDIIVTLYKCDGTLVAKDTTDATGAFFFDNLIPLMDYYAVFDLGTYAPDYGWTFQDQGGDDALDSDVNPAGVGPCTTIDPGERDSTYDAGIVALASIGNYVWHDRDGDGLQEGNEPGIEGVKVTLYRADSTPVAVQYTDAAGFYLFEYLMPGEYFLGFMYPDKWEKTYAHVGTNDYRDSDVDDSNGPNTTPTTYLSPGEIDERWDLGLYMCIPVGDFVWFDWDADGIQDPGENGINGVRVYVIDARTDEIVASTVTRGHPKRASDDGYWKVCVRPGSYYVKVARPGTLAVSGPFRGGDNTRDSDINHGNGLYTTYTFTVYSGDRLCDVDAGFHHQAVVGNYVWVDEDGDGYQDSGEPPVEGVIVRAYTMDNMMISETETDATGRYELEGLSEGSYYVRYVVPDGYDFTIPNAGPEEMDSDVDGSHGFGTTGEIRVRAGDVRPEIDAGVVYGVLATVVKGIRGWHEGGENVIEWEVIESEGRYRYRLERRVDGGKYEVVYDREVEGSGSERVYRYADRDVLKGGLYEYRLRVEEVGVREVLSERVSIYVRGEEGAGMVRVLPNPVDDELRVEYVSGGEERWTFGLYNSTGEMVDHWEEEVEDAGLQLSRRSVHHLPDGIYILKATSQQKQHIVKLTILH